MIIEAIVEFRQRLLFLNATIGMIDANVEAACIQTELQLISSKYQLPAKLLVSTESKNLEKCQHSHHNLFSITSKKVGVDEYKKALMTYLEDRLANLPQYDKEGNEITKRKQLWEMYENIRYQQFSSADLKTQVAKIREIVAEHRDVTGVKGFFNQFSDTKSLQKLNQLFDSENNLKTNSNSYFYSLQFR